MPKATHHLTLVCAFIWPGVCTPAFYDVAFELALIFYTIRPNILPCPIHQSINKRARVNMVSFEVSRSDAMKETALVFLSKVRFNDQINKVRFISHGIVWCFLFVVVSFRLFLCRLAILFFIDSAILKLCFFSLRLNFSRLLRHSVSAFPRR